MADLLASFLTVLDGRLALAACSVALAGFMRGFVGFGAALMTVPIFALLYGPLAAVPISTVIGMSSTLLLLPTAIRESERPVVVPVCLGVFLAAPLGAWVLVSVPAEIMRIAISFLTVAMVAALARGWRLEQEVPRALLFSAGAAGGLVQGSAGIGGPPVVAIALSRPGSAQTQRANVIGVMTAVAMSAIPPLAWYGLYTLEVVMIGVVLIPASYVGTVLGARYFEYGGHKLYRRAALATLLIVGAATLVAAIRDSVGG